MISCKPEILCISNNILNLQSIKTEIQSLLDLMMIRLRIFQLYNSMKMIHLKEKVYFEF